MEQRRFHKYCTCNRKGSADMYYLFVSSTINIIYTMNDVIQICISCFIIGKKLTHLFRILKYSLWFPIKTCTILEQQFRFSMNSGLTVFFGLKGDLSALFLALWVSQWQTDMDAVVRWQITQREAWGVVFYCQAFTHGGVMASAASCRGVAVAQGHWVGVAACHVKRQILPQKGQLPGLDICGCEASQGTHWLWKGDWRQRNKKQLRKKDSEFLWTYSRSLFHKHIYTFSATEIIINLILINKSS